VPSSTLEKHGLVRLPVDGIIRCIACSKNQPLCKCTNRPYYKSTLASPCDSRDLRTDMKSKCAGCRIDLKTTGDKFCKDLNQIEYQKCRHLEKTSPYNKSVDKVTEAIEIKRENDKNTSEEIRRHVADAVLDSHDIIDLTSDESDAETSDESDAETSDDSDAETNWRPENCMATKPKITDEILILTNTCRVYFETSNKGKDSRMVCCTCCKSVKGNNGCPCTYREGLPTTWHQDTELYCKFCASTLQEGKKACNNWFANQYNCNYQANLVKITAKAEDKNWVERTLKERSNLKRVQIESTTPSALSSLLNHCQNSTSINQSGASSAKKSKVERLIQTESTTPSAVPSSPNHHQNSTTINQSGASSAKKSKIERLISTKTLTTTETSIDQDFMPNSPLVSPVVSDHIEVKVEDEFTENQDHESTETDIDLSGLSPEVRKHVESLREMNQHLLCKNRSNEEKMKKKIKTLELQVEEKEKIAKDQLEIMCNISRGLKNK